MDLGSIYGTEPTKGTTNGSSGLSRLTSTLNVLKPMVSLLVTSIVAWGWEGFLGLGL